MDAGMVLDWTQVVLWIVVLINIIYAVIRFWKMPTNEQIALIKECLLNWVVQAEAELGSGTGKVKLSEVYGQFVKAFPMIKNAVSFDTFSAWVDEVLDDMRTMLASNANLREVVGVEKGDKV